MLQGVLMHTLYQYCPSAARITTFLTVHISVGSKSPYQVRDPPKRYSSDLGSHTRRKPPGYSMTESSLLTFDAFSKSIK